MQVVRGKAVPRPPLVHSIQRPRPFESFGQQEHTNKNGSLVTGGCPAVSKLNHHVLQLGSVEITERGVCAGQFIARGVGQGAGKALCGFAGYRQVVFIRLHA